MAIHFLLLLNKLFERLCPLILFPNTVSDPIVPQVFTILTNCILWKCVLLYG